MLMTPCPGHKIRIETRQEFEHENCTDLLINSSLRYLTNSTFNVTKKVPEVLKLLNVMSYWSGTTKTLLVIRQRSLDNNHHDRGPRAARVADTRPCLLTDQRGCSPSLRYSGIAACWRPRPPRRGPRQLRRSRGRRRARRGRRNRGPRRGRQQRRRRAGPRPRGPGARRGLGCGGPG